LDIALEPEYHARAGILELEHCSIV